MHRWLSAGGVVVLDHRLNRNIARNVHKTSRAQRNPMVELTEVSSIHCDLQNNQIYLLYSEVSTAHFASFLYMYIP